jgi:hypothetical protein
MPDQGLEMSAGQKGSQHNIPEVFSAYFPYLKKKIKVGLCDHHSVCEPLPHLLLNS